MVLLYIKRVLRTGVLSPEPPLRLAIVLYYLLRIYRNCAPSPNEGGLVAQEGDLEYLKNMLF